MLLYRFINKNLVAPPHRLLPAAVFIAALISFLYNPNSPFYTFSLPAPDDYVRLNETINWLQWQSWFDLSHPRLSPGAHTVVHLSRLLDMPLALMMRPFLQDWGYRNSAMLAAFVEPLILLGLLFAVISAMARPLVGRGNARLAVLFMPFASMLFFNFTPGRVAHHNWEILIAGIGLVALPRMILCRGGWKAGVFAAMAFAFGLSISPEIMPCLVLTLGCLALFSALQGGFALRNAAVFGGVLAITTAELLAAIVPTFEWFDRTASWFSTGYVIFAALSGATLVMAWLLGRKTENKTLRVALAATLFGFVATVFLYFVPDAVTGVFTDYGSSASFETVSEAQPLITALRIDFADNAVLVRAALCFLQYVFPALIALFTCCFIALKKSYRARVVGSIYAICLGGTFVLAIFVQSRFLWFTQIFQLAPLAYFTWNICSRFGEGWTIRRRNWAVLMAFIALGPLPGFAAPRIAGLFPGLVEAAPSCSVKGATDYIAGPWGYVSRPYTILSGIDEGPELLFRTPHNTIGANFGVPANQDVLDFFEARDDATALKVIRKWHVDLVLICRNTLSLYSNGSAAGPSASPLFVEKLVNGAPPAWLEPVEIPTSKDYLLFEVHYPKTQAKPPVVKK